MGVKDELHRVIDQLSEGDAHLALLALRDRDPLAIRLLTAPLDDEPVTPAEEEAVQLAREELARGEGIPWEQVRSKRALSA